MERLAASAAQKLIAPVFFVCCVCFFFSGLGSPSVRRQHFTHGWTFLLPALMTKLKAAASEIIHLEYPPGAALGGENLHIFPSLIFVVSNPVVVAILGSCTRKKKLHGPFLATVSKAAQPPCDSASLTLTDFSVKYLFYYQLLRLSKFRQRTN